MADAIQFPVEYLEALDKVVELNSFTQKFQEEGAEFANAKTVMVPEIEFDGGTEPYDRFKSEGKSELIYKPYELDCDREKTFYVDAVEDIDQRHIRTINQASEFERRYLVPEIDKNFFFNVGNYAKTKSTTKLTVANIKKELRNARTQMVNNGFASADLYVTADVLALLEDSIDRQFAGEGTITDTVGKYNIFDIYMVPDERLTGLNLAVIGTGGDKVVRHVWKRAAAYTFEPGQHTQGDGQLSQFRWVFGTIALNNKKAGMFVNGTGTSPYAVAEEPEDGDDEQKGGGE